MVCWLRYTGLHPVLRYYALSGLLNLVRHIKTIEMPIIFAKFVYNLPFL